jgi:hypothetical protein
MDSLLSLGDCRKMAYQIAPDFRSSSRRDNRRIVELCNGCRNTEDGRKDKQNGMSFDRNRLSQLAPPDLLTLPASRLSQQWREASTRDLSGRTPVIVRKLEKAIVEIARLVEEGERQAEIERKRREAECERWRREEEARRAAKALKDSKEELLQVIDAWAEAKRLEAFFADAERRAQDLPDEQRERTIERLRQARALIGSTDALDRFDPWRAAEEQ